MKDLEIIRRAIGLNTEAEDALKRIEALIDSLNDDADMLNALQNAGVDNWSGYDYAMEEVREMRGD